MKVLKWGALVFGAILLLSLFVPVGGVVFPFVVHLLLGGFAHLWASLPHMVPSLPGTMGFIVLLTASVCALQALLRKFARSKHGPESRWKPKWTLSLVGLILAAFGTACTTVGLAHHAAWLVREDVVYFDGGRSPVTKSISNCRQIVMALKLYASDHQGAYPLTLSELVSKDVLSHEDFERFNKAILVDGLPLPWVYLPGLNDASPGDLPVVVSPAPVSRSGYVVGWNDGGAMMINREEFEEAMTRY
ncbi:MAG: hypothetical protein ACAH88_06830, partial [Roseimicrobium sp.]